MRSSVTRSSSSKEFGGVFPLLFCLNSSSIFCSSNSSFCRLICFRFLSSSSTWRSHSISSLIRFSRKVSLFLTKTVLLFFQSELFKQQSFFLFSFMVIISEFWQILTRSSSSFFFALEIERASRRRCDSNSVCLIVNSALNASCCCSSNHFRKGIRA